ncbi:ADIPOR-like receptor [Penicillium subrubescens]|uniref:ADIPOR-like receptor n=1 Tax=Penicillium subrubescens TaxID=1316194 RepID=UPI002544DE53|nr:ADIPOR-like receptor [Penicillium subrubescens]KAJ5891972.1 ADIPOR-like receptor [Penicillium subrubescens]
MPRQRRPVQETEPELEIKVSEVANSALEVPPKIMKKLLHWDDLPPWQRDNHHIHTGYRPASSSFLASFQSLSYLHNESVNIYTHLLPGLAAIPAGYQLHRVLAPRYQTADDSDIAAFACFFAGAAFCLGMSATYHTISNHSPRVARIGNALDYIGIVGLIVGSFVPSVFYGFYCVPALQHRYWTMICTIGLGCVCVSVVPQFRTPRWRPFRASMFVGMGLSAVFPVLHGVALSGWSIGLGWLLLQGFLYILGASIYAARVPERLRPGQFDLFGHSHQIFHVLVVCAAVTHLTGLLKAFDYRHSGSAEVCQIPRG